MMMILKFDTKTVRGGFNFFFVCGLTKRNNFLIGKVRNLPNTSYNTTYVCIYLLSQSQYHKILLLFKLTLVQVAIVAY